jgi:hypothetical protein
MLLHKALCIAPKAVVTKPRLHMLSNGRCCCCCH